MLGVSDVREIGDVNECVIERGEDTSHAKDELACEGIVSGVLDVRPVQGRRPLKPTFSNLGPQRDVLLRAALDLLLGCHVR